MDSNLNLKVLAVFTGLLEPYPVEITQRESQLVLLKGNHFFDSPYLTESQKTTVKLSSSTIESYSKLEPTNSRGSTITYGPFKSIESYSVSYFYNY